MDKAGLFTLTSGLHSEVIPFIEESSIVIHDIVSFDHQKFCRRVEGDRKRILKDGRSGVRALRRTDDGILFKLFLAYLPTQDIRGNHPPGYTVGHFL